MSRTITDPGALQLIARDVRPDGRRRVTLGKALDGLDPDAAFAVYRDDLGRIILDPQVSIPAREAWLYRNPKRLEKSYVGLARVRPKRGATSRH